jgi:hypothetical protein
VRPEVVLIMEGTNDLGTEGNRLSATRSALEDMVDEALSRETDAMIATLPPARRQPGEVEDVMALNAEIRSIAFANGVRLVDVYAAMASGSCTGLTSFGLRAPRGRSAFAVDLPCIGDDDRHPTAEGYAVIAAAFGFASEWQRRCHGGRYHDIRNIRTAAAQKGGRADSRPPPRHASTTRGLPSSSVSCAILGNPRRGAVNRNRTLPEAILKRRLACQGVNSVWYCRTGPRTLCR